MKAFLKSNSKQIASPTIKITDSKSESNRLLILQRLYPNISIENLSESDDTKILKQALSSSSSTINVHHAGTAMRFLTAYFATSVGSEIILSGSARMHQRPIKILVDALRDLGAQIEYLEEEGYPPIKIFGKKLKGNSVHVKANISSQYITALMLIAPALEKGLTIILEGEITSRPYIEMTLSILKKLGINCSISGNKIQIEVKLAIDPVSIMVESDWSSASYFYSLVALSEKSSVTLRNYYKKSLQGDSALVSIFKKLGVDTVFNASETSIFLTKFQTDIPKNIFFDLADTPDIAQTIAVTCFGLGVGCKLSGLHTLKIKETDRLSALKKELTKLGAQVTISNNSFELKANSSRVFSELNKNIVIDTYDDHRMAMSFAPLSLLFPITIDHAMVVTKSFPSYWRDIAMMGVDIDLQ